MKRNWAKPTVTGLRASAGGVAQSNSSCPHRPVDSHLPRAAQATRRENSAQQRSAPGQTPLSPLAGSIAHGTHANRRKQTRPRAGTKFLRARCEVSRGRQLMHARPRLSNGTRCEHAGSHLGEARRPQPLGIAAWPDVSARGLLAAAGVTSPKQLTCRTSRGRRLPRTLSQNLRSQAPALQGETCRGHSYPHRAARKTGAQAPAVSLVGPQGHARPLSRQAGCGSLRG